MEDKSLALLIIEDYKKQNKRQCKWLTDTLDKPSI